MDVRGGFYMSRVYKDFLRIYKAMPVAFFQNSLKYLFKQVGVLKTAGVVFAKRGKVGNGIKNVQPQKPPVRHVYLYFLNGLAHAPDSVQVLYEGNFDQHDWVHAGASLIG